MSRRDNPAFQFYPADWSRDTGVLSASARGIWIDVLCVLWWQKNRGRGTFPVDGWARQTRCTASEFEAALSEFEATQTADVSRNGHGLVTLVSRRMVNDEKERQGASSRKRKERYSRTCHVGVTLMSQESHDASSSSSSSSCPTDTLSEGDSAHRILTSRPELSGLSWEQDAMARHSWRGHPLFETLATEECAEWIAGQAVLMGAIAAPGAWLRKAYGRWLDEAADKELAPAADEPRARAFRRNPEAMP
jgi:hypothetical protein